MKFYFSFILFFSFINLASAQLIFKQMPSKEKCEGFSSKWTPGNNANIVGYWKMNGTVGAVADGASLSAATIGPTGVVHGTGVTYATGMLAQGINFTGAAANYIDMGTPTALNDLSAMTVMIWVKISSNTRSGTLFYKSDDNVSSGWMFYISSTKRLSFNVVRETADVQYFTNNTSALFTNGTWVQMVATWDGTLTAAGIHIYVNGAEWGTTGAGYTQDGSGNHLSDAAQSLWLGKSGNGSNTSTFKGGIDETAIWNRVLSPAEVAYLYKNQKCN